MGKIQKLEDNVINLIAAGEVVERPASVVKELVENSIDAGSTNIIISIVDGGTKEISVKDNGEGISAEDLPLAFTQHATSKIHQANDLNSIYTLGFRGEALASIASVSKVAVESRTNTERTVANISQGEVKITNQAKNSGETGLTINIIDLFHNIPARLKFLKTPATEFKQILNVFVQIALAHPHIHFELHKDGSLYKRLPKVSNLQDRIYELFGQEISNNMYPVTYEGAVKIHGFIGKPTIARSDNKVQYLFLNGRGVTDKTVQTAVAQAYQGFIHKDFRPVYFLYVDLDAEQVDVNVHPRKQEVKFADSGAIFRQVYHAVQDTLTAKTKQDIQNIVSSHQNLGNIADSSAIQSTKEDRIVDSFTISLPSTSRISNSPRKGIIGMSMQFSAELLKDSGQVGLESSVTEITETIVSEEQFDPWQLFNTYIVYSKGEQLILVDQHAAAERIAFERLQKQYSTNIVSKPLLIGLTIELPFEHKQELLEQADELSKLGFDLSDVGGNSIQVNAIPETIPGEHDIRQTLVELSEVLQNSTKQTNSDLAEQTLATMACHSSVRAGQKLSKPEMLQILNDLKVCEHPASCPHGRPVSWVIEKYQIEKNFKRIM